MLSAQCAQVDNVAEHKVAILCTHDCAPSHQRETLGAWKWAPWVTALCCNRVESSAVDTACQTLVVGFLLSIRLLAIHCRL